jgi:hypothetical protein
MKKMNEPRENREALPRSQESWRPPPIGEKPVNDAKNESDRPLKTKPILRLVVIALVIAVVVAGANWEKISRLLMRGGHTQAISAIDSSQDTSASKPHIDAASPVQTQSAVSESANQGMEQTESPTPAVSSASAATGALSASPLPNGEAVDIQAIRQTDLSKAASEDTLKGLRQQYPQENLGYFSADPRFGDIMGDGAEEAAIWVRYRLSGEASTPSLSDVLVYRLNEGQPKLLAMLNGGDRAYGGIESVVIQDGKLIIGRYKPVTPDACMACIGFIETTTYTWDGNKLVSGSVEIKKYHREGAQSSPLQPRKETASTPPLAADARHVLEQQMHEQSGGVMRLLSFEKTNGIERDLMGTRGYQIDYTAEVEFLDDCAWVAGGKWFGQNFAVIRDRSRATSQIMELYDLEWVNKGSRRRFASSVMLEQAEHGWRLSTFRHPLR